MINIFFTKMSFYNYVDIDISSHFLCQLLLGPDHLHMLMRFLSGLPLDAGFLFCMTYGTEVHIFISLQNNTSGPL